ncbi:MAG: co-chaperone GroES [Pirellulaceae bacterium]|jgi:chaperonin GroES|nr:co-chaperone GroES [Pirellulaceae bacterium]MDG2469350.1 co-chaperone GroES [Pirellulaceae bacterium]
MRIEPLGDKLIVSRLTVEETTSGGIFLPDSAQDKPNEARVLSVGPGQLNEDGSRTPLQVADGDRIIFSGYAGTEVVFDDQEFLILSEIDVLAVIE